jgi:hypothetical protein
MRTFQLFLIVLLLACAVPALAVPKMRPYSGVGVVQISSLTIDDSIQLYDDPGIARCCTLNLTAVRNLNAWLFGSTYGTFLLATDHKGDWIEIEHDDAGRTGWIMPEHHWNYLPWEQFLKGKMVVFLRNSPKNQIQLFSRPGMSEGTPLATKRPLKVIVAQGDWAYTLIDQSSSGWIRWRDRDGRLLIGFDIPATK